MRINVAKSRLNHMPKISFLLFLMLAGFSGFTARAHTGIATTVPDHDAVIDQAPEILRFVFPGEVTITNARIRPVNEKLNQRLVRLLRVDYRVTASVNRRHLDKR